MPRNASLSCKCLPRKIALERAQKSIDPSVLCCYWRESIVVTPFGGAVVALQIKRVVRLMAFLSTRHDGKVAGVLDSKAILEAVHANECALKNRQLVTISPSLSECTSLRKLDVSYNLFESVENIEQLKNLRELLFYLTPTSHIITISSLFLYSAPPNATVGNKTNREIPSSRYDFTVTFVFVSLATEFISQIKNFPFEIAVCVFLSVREQRGSKRSSIQDLLR